MSQDKRKTNRSKEGQFFKIINQIRELESRHGDLELEIKRVESSLDNRSVDDKRIKLILLRDEKKRVMEELRSLEKERGNLRAKDRVLVAKKKKKGE